MSGAITALAQAPAFDVVSVKVNRSDQQRGFGGLPRGLSVTNYTLFAIIRAVWNLTDQQIIGGPSWIIVDRTGLTGRFDLVLSFNRNLADAASDLPSLFAAAPEQLGLRLEPQTTPTAVLVIDSVEKPSEN